MATYITKIIDRYTKIFQSIIPKTVKHNHQIRMEVIIYYSVDNP